MSARSLPAVLGRTGAQCLDLRAEVLEHLDAGDPAGKDEALKVAALLREIAALTAAYHDRLVCTCGKSAYRVHDTTCRIYRRTS